MPKIIILSFLLSIVILLPASAKEHTVLISGQVITADGKPAEGISLAIENTSYGTVTDHNGAFQMRIPAGKHMLTVFSIWAHRREIPIDVSDQAEKVIPPIMIIETAQQLGEVVVTGTRTEKHLSDTPILTTVIREKDLRKAGAVSTLETLQDNIPGIVISPNAMGNNLRIRGLNSRYVLFLVDGERMVSEGAGGNVNLDQLDVNSIRRIEMIEGASSALYGSNAVGAVINIITKEPAHRLELGANQTVESYQTWRTRIDAASALKKFSTRAGAFRNASDGFGGEGGEAYAARYEDYGANLKALYKPTGKSDISLVGRFFRHETFNPAGSMNVKHKLSKNFTTGIQGGFTSLDNKNTLRISANFNKYLDFDIFEKKNNESLLINSASSFSTRAVNTFIPNTNWELLGGLEYNREENFAREIFGSKPSTKNLDDINLFAQTQYKLRQNLDIVGGARYTHNSQFGNALSPKLSLMYKISGFIFRGGIGTAFRAPSIKELYYDFDHQGMFWIYGNPYLKAERGLYSSLSAEYSYGTFNLSMTGYYNNIGDKITQYRVVNSKGGNELYYKNVSSATLRGMNISVAYTALRQLDIRGSYGFSDAQDNSTGLQLPSNVKHSGTCTLTWNANVLKTPFSLQLSGRINSPILYEQLSTDNAGNQVVEKQESKSYSIWKIVFLKPFTWRKNVFEFTAKADNIFNFKDAAFVNPGRQYMLGLRYSFKTQ